MFFGGGWDAAAAEVGGESEAFGGRVREVCMIYLCIQGVWRACAARWEAGLARRGGSLGRLR